MKLNLDLPRTKGIFVTGTDTGVGKSLVAGAIANFFTLRGKKTGVFKPVASGCLDKQGRLISSDAEFLKICAQSDLPLETITPVRFSIPAAPVVCEQYENKKVSLKDIADAYRHIHDRSEIMIVEGIGGVLVPITENVTILDLAVEMDLPAVIVARPDLGTINHTLMTLAIVRAAGLKVAGVVISGSRENPPVDEQTAASVISGFGRTNILADVPFDRQSDTENCLLGQAVTESINNFNWFEILEQQD